MSYEIETKRLFLRAPRMDDVPVIAAGLDNYSVTRFLSRVPYPYFEADAIAWLSGLPENTPDWAAFAIERPDAGLIGVISIENHLGFWLAEAHWGQGYATEAGRAILEWHFANSDATGIVSAAHYDNPASLNVQRKLGFVVTGSEMRMVVSRREEVEHIDTMLTREAFERLGVLS